MAISCLHHSNVCPLAKSGAANSDIFWTVSGLRMISAALAFSSSVLP